MPKPKSLDPVKNTNICLAASDREYLLLWQGAADGSQGDISDSSALSTGCRELIARARKCWAGGLLSGPPAPAPGARSAPGTKTDLKRQLRELDKQNAALRLVAALKAQA